MSSFPFLRLPVALAVLRVTVALLFMAHAVVRIANGTIPQFAAFLSEKGIPFGVATVWAITAFELGGGTLLIINRLVQPVAAGFMALLIMGIVLIHAQLGWFVGEHGTGGSEYSVALLAALVVISSAERYELGLVRALPHDL